MPDKYDEIANELVYRQVLSGASESPHDLDIDELQRDIATALRTVTTVQPGFVRVGDTDKPLNGILPETLDGYLCGHNVNVYYPPETEEDDPETYRLGEHDAPDWDDNPDWGVIALDKNGGGADVRDCYSTPEAAAAARSAKT